jgi:splicing factor 1
MGLILGPRGNHLEELKKETKCNIILRGKGSIKAGMTGINKNTGRAFDGLEDPLHAFITGPTAEDVQCAVKRIKELIDMNIYEPDCEKVAECHFRLRPFMLCL